MFPVYCTILDTILQGAAGMRDPRNAAPAQIEPPTDIPPITHTSNKKIKLPPNSASRGNPVNTPITRPALTTLATKPTCTQAGAHKGGARRDTRANGKSVPTPTPNNLLSLCSQQPVAQRGTTPQYHYISNTKHSSDTHCTGLKGAVRCGPRFTELTASHTPYNIIAICLLPTYAAHVNILQGYSKTHYKIRPTFEERHEKATGRITP